MAFIYKIGVKIRRIKAPKGFTLFDARISQANPNVAELEFRKSLRKSIPDGD